MRIGIIGTVGIPANYGGFETLVEHLTRAQSEKFDLTVYCSTKSYSKKRKRYNGAKLKYLPLKANGMQSILYDGLSMFHAARYSDLILILGVSGCIFLPVLKKFYKNKVIVNIDGLEWKRDKWGRIAKWFYELSEQIAVRNADVVIADNNEIKEYVKSRYKKNAILIAYGADHVQKQKISMATLEEFPFLIQKYAFKVCRIEPENNVHLILEVFANFQELNLVIIGNWCNSRYGVHLKRKYSDIENILLLDPIYDQNKLDQIRGNCYVYLHGHSAGGTNPSLIEAMYLKLPIISYSAGYNKATTGDEAIFFSNKDELTKIIKNLDNKKLSQVALSMLKIAKERYTWEKISNQYAELFDSKIK